jgi:hypothetical protein
MKISSHLQLIFCAYHRDPNSTQCLHISLSLSLTHEHKILHNVYTKNYASAIQTCRKIIVNFEVQNVYLRIIRARQREKIFNAKFKFHKIKLQNWISESSQIILCASNEIYDSPHFSLHWGSFSEKFSLTIYTAKKFSQRI